MDTINDAIAECSTIYFPKAPVSFDSANLRPVSDIAVHPSRLRDLRKFLGDPKAKFTTPEQGVLLEHALAGRDNILGILGTAFGKTTLIMMMSKMYAQGRVTVVVLPLSALHDDLDRRANAHGLRVSRWSPQEFNPNVNIITVAVEYLAHSQFRTLVAQLTQSPVQCLLYNRFLSDLYVHNALFQLVFDEIHKLITDANFRDVFRQFWTLKLVQTPIIGLTASLPDTLMPTFQDLSGLSWKVIRMSSNRKEMVYGVITVPKGMSLPARVSQYLEAKLRDYDSPDRAIIFCRTTAAADDMAAQLGVKSFHSKSIDTNPTTMQAWRTGTNLVMVSTSILGCGLDYSSIRDVLHVDVAHSILDMYQEDSRGGRDGQSCCALTFIPEGRPKPPSKETYPIGTDEVYQWATQKEQCLRIIPSLFLDGVATTCTLLKDAHLCLFCASQLHKSPPPKLSLLPTRPPLQPALLTANPRLLPHTSASATPMQKAVEQQYLPPVTPFFPSVPKGQPAATPGFSSVLATPMQNNAGPQHVPPILPFFSTARTPATPDTSYLDPPAYLRASTPASGVSREHMATNLEPHPQKRSLSTHEQWPVKYPRVGDYSASKR